jgi:hypothetical protein
MRKLFDFARKLLARLSDDRPAPPNRLTPDLSVRAPAQSPLRATPAETLLQARRDALNAEQGVIRVSRAHLATLMAFPPRDRMAHLKDPELTEADLIELANSIRAALPAPSPLDFPRWLPTGLSQSLRLNCGNKCLLALVISLSGAGTGALAWHNTGSRIVGSDVTWIVDWRLPDGNVLHGAWNARMPVVAMPAHDGVVVLRRWLNGRGYATTEVGERWLLDHSFTYLVVPTGGTGAASPANR